MEKKVKKIEVEVRQDNFGGEVLRWWYKDHRGVIASVIIYSNPDGGFSIGSDNSPEYAPVYVSLAGIKPEPLIDVLEENIRLKREAISFDRWVKDLNQRMLKLEQKPEPKKRWFR